MNKLHWIKNVDLSELCLQMFNNVTLCLLLSSLSTQFIVKAKQHARGYSKGYPICTAPQYGCQKMEGDQRNQCITRVSCGSKECKKFSFEWSNDVDARNLYTRRLYKKMENVVCFVECVCILTNILCKQNPISCCINWISLSQCVRATVQAHVFLLIETHGALRNVIFSTTICRICQKWFS